jgi:DNA-binding XRE family transcriptional regulator/predicted DNA-binding transcriptional regulator AlpA
MTPETKKLIGQVRRLMKSLDLVLVSEAARIEPRIPSGQLSTLARWTRANGLPLYRLPPLKSVFVPRECLPMLSRYADGQRRCFDIPVKIRRQIEQLREKLAALQLVSSDEVIERLGLQKKWFWETVKKHPEWFVVFPPSETTWLPESEFADFETFFRNWREDLGRRREKRRQPKTPIYNRLPVPEWSVASDQNPIVSVDLERLRGLRKELKLNQEEMASELRVNRTTFVALENGKRPVRLKEVEKIEEVFRKRWLPEKWGSFRSLLD